MIVRLFQSLYELCLVLCDSGILFRIVSRLALILVNSAEDNVVPSLRYFIQPHRQIIELVKADTLAHKLALVIFPQVGYKGRKWIIFVIFIVQHICTAIACFIYEKIALLSGFSPDSKAVFSDIYVI